VLWDIWQLRPIERSDNPQAHFKRSTSLILRMDNLSCDMLSPKFSGKLATI
jgi:hypothetical protein